MPLGYYVCYRLRTVRVRGIIINLTGVLIELSAQKKRRLVFNWVQLHNCSIKVIVSAMQRQQMQPINTPQLVQQFFNWSKHNWHRLSIDSCHCFPLQVREDGQKNVSTASWLREESGAKLPPCLGPINRIVPICKYICFTQPRRKNNASKVRLPIQITWIAPFVRYFFCARFVVSLPIDKTGCKCHLFIEIQNLIHAFDCRDAFSLEFVTAFWPIFMYIIHDTWVLLLTLVWNSLGHVSCT